ncbi:MAG: hypothetical protein IAE85_15555 [Anaerolinea sp.]|nr:hypothetical protein [Anaerolinea sp.]
MLDTPSIIAAVCDTLSRSGKLRDIIAPALLVFVLSGVAGCIGFPAETQVPHPTQTAQVVATRLLALAVGELEIENECLRVNGYLLVWPPDFTVIVQDVFVKRKQQENRVEIRDELTGATALWRSGDVVQIGGGEVSYLSLDEQLRQGTVAECSKGRAGAFWLVGDVAASVPLRGGQ